MLVLEESLKAYYVDMVEGAVDLDFGLQLYIYIIGIGDRSIDQIAVVFVRVR